MNRAKRKSTDSGIRLRIALASLGILYRRFGWWDSFRIVLGLAGQKLKREPWKHLPPPNDEKDQLSRTEIGDAVLLYRVLKKRYGSQTALEVTAQLVELGAIMLFEYLLDPIDPETIQTESESERRNLVARNVDRFPNADARIDEASSTRVAFTVTHCRFPGLVNAAGHPELAPVFCSADKKYFEEYVGVKFERPETIASGGATCPFVLSLKQR